MSQQCCNTLLRQKSSLRIVWCNITLTYKKAVYNLIYNLNKFQLFQPSVCESGNEAAVNVHKKNVLNCHIEVLTTTAPRVSHLRQFSLNIWHFIILLNI